MSDPQGVPAGAQCQPKGPPRQASGASHVFTREPSEPNLMYFDHISHFSGLLGTFFFAGQKSHIFEDMAKRWSISPRVFGFVWPPLAVSEARLS